MRATLKLGPDVLPITLKHLSEDAIVFSARRGVRSGPSILTVEVNQTARIAFPVQVRPTGAEYRATIHGTPLVTRHRHTPNAMIREALGLAA